MRNFSQVDDRTRSSGVKVFALGILWVCACVAWAVVCDLATLTAARPEDRDE